MKLITGLTFAVITVLLLLVYRSIATTLLILPMVFIGLGATRGTIAFLGYHGMVGLSTFVVNILTALAIAAGTDYAIFLVAAIKKPAISARIAKPLSTRCTGAPLTSFSDRD